MKRATMLSLLLLLPAQIATAGLLTTLRGVDELKLMNERELAGEATTACAEVSIQKHTGDEIARLNQPQEASQYFRAAIVAHNYLKRIRLVVRDKLGTEPEWWDKIQKESGRSGYKHKCFDIFESYFPVKQKSNGK